MLKPSPSRNQKSKGSRAKQALQICLLLVITMWLMYQAIQFYHKKVIWEESSKEATEKLKNGHQIMRLGRKNLNPKLGELAEDFGKHHDEELELEDEESKLRENEEDESGAGNDEINASDQEKAEEGEHEQLEDLIDEDDKEE